MQYKEEEGVVKITLTDNVEHERHASAMEGRHKTSQGRSRLNCCTFSSMRSQGIRFQPYPIQSHLTSPWSKRKKRQHRDEEIRSNQRG